MKRLWLSVGRFLRRENCVLVTVALVLATFPFVNKSPFVLNLLILTLVYSCLAQTWNLLGGFAGQISLGHAMFFGLGAYTSTVLLTWGGVSPWLGGLAGACAAGVFALLIGYPLFRLTGHYFTIATIALGEIVLEVMNSLEWVGGAKGMSVPFVRDTNGRPIDSIYYLQFNQTKLPYYFIVLALMLILAFLTAFVARSKWGFYFRAIKGDQNAARALGVNVLWYKLLALALSAAFTALLGTFYVQYLLFIDPENAFSLRVSILICLAAILGGVGSVWGPPLGAFILIPLGELTRSQLGGAGSATDLILYGALIVLVSVFQPNGLVGLPARFARLGRRLRRSRPEKADVCPTGD